MIQPCKMGDEDKARIGEEIGVHAVHDSWEKIEISRAYSNQQKIRSHAVYRRDKQGDKDWNYTGTRAAIRFIHWGEITAVYWWTKQPETLAASSLGSSIYSSASLHIYHLHSLINTAEILPKSIQKIQAKNLHPSPQNRAHLPPLPIGIHHCFILEGF